jgi:hypothetical protein
MSSMGVDLPTLAEDYDGADVDADAEFYAARTAAAVAVNRSRLAAADAARGIRHQDVVCHYWLKDRCGAGDRCRYLHVLIEDKVQLCQYFVKRAPCPDGAECMFRHYYTAAGR